MEKLFLLLLISFVYYSNSFSQNTIKEKIDSLKGKAKEITIITDKETLSFKDDDAEYILKRLKKNKEAKIKIIEDEIFINGKKFDLEKIDSIMSNLKIKFDNFNADSLIKFKEIKFNFSLDDSTLIFKDIKIDFKESDKNVIIVEKDADGNVKKQIYYGKEADEKIKEFEGDKLEKKEKKKVIIEKEIIKKEDKN